MAGVKRRRGRGCARHQTQTEIYIQSPNIILASRLTALGSRKVLGEPTVSLETCLLSKQEYQMVKKELKRLASEAAPTPQIPEDRRLQAPPRCHCGCPQHALGGELCDALCRKSRSREHLPLRANSRPL